MTNNFQNATDNSESDSQSVKTIEESGGIKGYDGGKQVKGRKRHILAG